ncbi:MAG TPA: sigma-54 dependent transcriptional regulator [Rhodanobacteraceae bacterium]|nr:sigma-54 dependent transcriptional regulator [Rhodanobacteraceae bacterium]
MGSIFSSFVAGRGKQLPPARRLVWLGDLQPAVARELADAGWEAMQLPLDDDAIEAVGHAGADVAVVDFADGDDALVARIDALTSARQELQWLAVASEQALSQPRVCELIHAMCFDFFIPPLHDSGITASLGHAWGKAQLLAPTARVASRPESDFGLVGTSSAIEAVREQLAKFAGFDMPVLLTGETGTGKEVAACAVHAHSALRGGPFVAVNCGALPENLVQSELFGHERGAFTGANARKIGRIEAANGGVIFLDEIGDMPLEAQSNLLRFLEEQTIERVGSTQSIRINARVVAATHVDLQRAVREGRFREDLYYRLNVLHVHLPPLRERSGDAEMLACHFLEQFRQRHHSRARMFSAAALKAIVAHDWPGNVRELINRVHRAAVTAETRLLGPVDLGLASAESSRPGLHAARAQADRDTIAEQLRNSSYNMSECARRLGISRVSLYRLCRKYGLRIDTAALGLLGVPLSPDVDGPALLATCVDWAARMVPFLTG